MKELLKCTCTVRWNIRQCMQKIRKYTGVNNSCYCYKICAAQKVILFPWRQKQQTTSRVQVTSKIQAFSSKIHPRSGIFFKLLPRFTHFLQNLPRSDNFFQDTCKNNALSSKILEVKFDRFLRKMYWSSTGVVLFRKGHETIVCSALFCFLMHLVLRMVS